MSAFRATFSDMKLVKTRQVAQLIFEVPIEDFDAAYEVLGGMPVPSKERWFGIAAIKAPQQEEDHEKPRPSARPTPPTDGATRMDWRDVQPSAQAVLRGKDAKFRAFLREKQGLFTVIDETTAANAIRAFCGVESRSELSSNHKARILWHQLDRDYEGWLAAERIGA